VAHGALSLRGAAHEARMATIERRTGRRPLPGRVSLDGRMAGDWVPQYTGILATRSLPIDWPQAMSVDSFDVRVKVLDAHGKPLKKGKFLYSVFGAYGYEAGSRRASSGTSRRSRARASTTGASSSASSAAGQTSLCA
jgi:hypothetical protein